MTPAADPKKTTDRELTISRIFNAPPALVFRVWTQPSHMRQWWGPRGYTTLSCEVDLRPDGNWRVESRHFDGARTVEYGVFREIKPERLVFTHAWESEKGEPGSETLVTVTFEAHEDGTKMTFLQAGFGSIETRDGHAEGWNESFDMLAEHLTNV